MDRGFGNWKKGLQTCINQGKIRTRKDVQDFFRRRTWELNKGNPGKYLYFSLHIPPQSENVKIIRFKGIKSTYFLRARFNVERITSLINYISPWHHVDTPQKFVRGSLREIIGDPIPRIRKSNIRTTSAIVRRKWDLANIPSRLTQFNQRTDWLQFQR